MAGDRQPLPPARQRRTILACMAVSGAAAALIWWGCFRWIGSSPAGFELAIALIGAATLFGLVPGIEAVAH